MTFLKMKLIGYVAGRNRPYKCAHDDSDHVNRFINLEATVAEDEDEDNDGVFAGVSYYYFIRWFYR